MVVLLHRGVICFWMLGLWIPHIELLHIVWRLLREKLLLCIYIKKGSLNPQSILPLPSLYSTEKKRPIFDMIQTHHNHFITTFPPSRVLFFPRTTAVDK